MAFFDIADTGDRPYDIAGYSRYQDMHLLQTKLQRFMG